MYKLTKSNSILRLADGACIPDDPANRDYQEYLEWLTVEGNLPEPVDPDPEPTFEELVAANTAAIQVEMDRQAAVKGYDNILSACSYAAQATGAPFQAEGAAFLQWRSDVWTQAYAVLADVQAGTVPLPTPEEAVAAMPALVLPGAV